MLFNSPEFLFIFLPFACLLFYGCRRISKTAQLGSIILLSLFFYGYWQFENLFILLFSLASNFFFAKTILNSDSERVRRIAFFCGVTIALSILGYFKYYNFFMGMVQASFGVEFIPTSGEIPIGISFYTFTAVAFLADVYSRRIDHFNLTEYGTTITYFPHLVAGPILFHHSTIPQLRNHNGFQLSAEKIMLFFFFFSVGLFKKTVLADSIAQFSDPIFDQAALGLVPKIGEAWRAALCYTLQLYYDFSGYSDMAIGLACLIGIKIPLNFNSPYKSQNITEFWQRWHISLGYFFRTYLYIPLGGNRKGPTRTLINVFVVMFLCGLWHGAGWTFIIWGILHGGAMVVHRLFASKVNLPRNTATKTAAILTTFLFVTFAWVIFRAETMTSAWVILKAMIGIGEGTMNNLPYKWSELWIAALLFIAWVMPNSYQLVRQFQPAIVLDRWDKPNWLLKRLPEGVWKESSWFSYGVGALTALLLSCGTMYMFINGQVRYLYFDF